MRHRIKAGKVGSFAPEKQMVEIDQLENREVADEVEEIFEEDSELSNDDEALAAMEFHEYAYSMARARVMRGISMAKGQKAGACTTILHNIHVNLQIINNSKHRRWLKI